MREKDQLSNIKRVLIAGKAVVESTPELLKSKSRGAMLAALRYAGIINNIKLSSEQLEAASDVLLLGVGNNDYFDLGSFRKKRHLSARRRLRKHEERVRVIEYSPYLANLRRIEESRPKIGEKVACFAYRDELNLLSMGYTCSVAFGTSMWDFIKVSSEGVKIQDQAPAWFGSMYAAVMALQVIDDMVGWRGDVAKSRPSFFTAYGIENRIEEISDEEKTSRFRQMESLFRQYLERASSADPVNIFPIRLAVSLIGQSVPILSEALNTNGLSFLNQLVISERDATSH